MFSTLLILTFCAVLPAQIEADMSPVLAPAILVEETFQSGDSSFVVETTDLAEIIVPRTSEKTEITLSPDLGTALVVDSN